MTLIAFSSDSRESYIVDIYKAASLPDNSVIHFRYKKKYIDPSLHEKPRSIIGNSCIVSFAATEGVHLPENGFHLVPVRNSKVVHAEYDEDTEVFHVYLKLKEFIDLDIGIIDSEKLPPHMFLSKQSELTYKKSKWKTRVELLAKHSKMPHTFYLIKGIYEKRKPIPISYNPHSHTSFYELNHGKDYVLQLSTANPTSKNSGLDVSYDDKIISSNVSSPIETTIQFDNVSINLSIKDIQTRSLTSLIKITPKNKEENKNSFTNTVEIKLKRKIINIICFPVCATAAIWGLLLARSANDLCDVIFSTFVLLTSLSFLYHLYDKK